MEATAEPGVLPANLTGDTTGAMCCSPPPPVRAGLENPERRVGRHRVADVPDMEAVTLGAVGLGRVGRAEENDDIMEYMRIWAWEKGFVYRLLV